MFCTSILASALILQGGSSTAAKDLTELEDAIKGIASLENVAVFMDVKESMKAPVASGVRHEGWAMVYLAALADREWSEIQGVQVFARRVVTQATRRAEAQIEVLRIMDSLSDADLEDALNNGFSLAKLPPQDAAKLLTRGFNWQGMVQTSAVGDPHETFNAFRDGMMQTSVRLMMMDKYVVYDENGRKYETYKTDDMVKIAKEESEYVVPPKVPPQEFNVTPSPGDGTLDFGEGQIMTVGEVLALAGAAFKAIYHVDSRIRHDPLFVSGRYTRERFEACSRRVLYLEPFREVAESGELEDLLNRLADRVQRMDDDALGNRGSLISLQDLEVSDPYAYRHLVKSGVDPSRANIMVLPGFFLDMDPNAKILTGTEMTELDGKQIEVTIHQKLGLGIGF